MGNPKKKGNKKKSKGKKSNNKSSAGSRVWRVGVDPIESGEELSYDPTAYLCLQNFRLSWPCLSFDILKDHLGEKREHFPYEFFMVAGTQASDPNRNGVCLARLANVGQGKHGPKAAEEDSDDDLDDSDSEEDGEAAASFSCVEIHHKGGINRVRVMKQEHSALVATWGETGHVQVWDMTSHLKHVSGENATRMSKNKVKEVHQTPLHIVQHSTEGYAMDWSPASPFHLLSGDCNGQILYSQGDGNGNWSTNPQSFQGHSASVEDIQWSPVEQTVFSSCSVDKTIKIWDTRQKSKPGLSYVAHDSDVNVISWNSLTSCMIASGAEDGSMRIWDMRYISNGQYVANFDYCKKAITSIEWSPHEGSMIATSSGDNQICFWDLSVERDADEEIEHMQTDDNQQNVEIPDDIPPQLLFVHQGQNNIKEVHWHSQIPGAVMSTAFDGFNIFRPANL